VPDGPGEGLAAARPRTEPEGRPAGLAEHPQVTAALAARNEPLAPFWLDRGTETGGRPAIAPMSGLRILVIDAKDTFTSMLSHQLRSLGLAVDVRPHHDIPYRDPARSYDLALMGPGPGDPLDPVNPKIIAMRRITAQLLDGTVPFVSICLGHQVLCSCLGFPLIRKTRPSQGLQREIDYFGRSEHVGFYNTFSAHSDIETMHSPWIGAEVRVSRDDSTGEVHALRGPGFASAQFHPESVLTRRGPQILADMFTWALTSARTSASRPAG
jgi:phenazine biosynthesis protein phzE